VIAVPDDLAGRLRFEDRRDDGAGTRWLQALPGILARLAVDWQLTLGPPIEPGGVTSVVVPARLTDGRLAVLKVPVPEDEQAGEAAGLALVAGRGAVRLLGHDAATGSMLLERVRADRSLLDHPDTEVAIDTAATLLRRWWDAGGAPDEAHTPTVGGGDPELLGQAPDLRSIPVLGSLTSGFAATLAARRQALLARGVAAVHLDVAVESLRSVPSDGDVLLHTDLHLGNVLATGDGRWVVIDPKPAWGPPAYDVQALVRDGLPKGAGFADAVRRRFDRLVDHLEVDRALAHTWTVTRVVELGAWALVDADAPDLADRTLALLDVLGPPVR
jgi:streptomycin 6-kinase